MTTQNIFQNKLSKDELEAAREWFADCTWADLSESDINDLSDEAIEKGIKRHFSGGIEEFKRSC